MKFFALLFSLLCSIASAHPVAIEAIGNLADPAKLATLAERGANPRVQKITYWLATARAEGHAPGTVTDAALSRFGWKGTPKGELTKAAMLRNVTIAECLRSRRGRGTHETSLLSRDISQFRNSCS